VKENKQHNIPFQTKLSNWDYEMDIDLTFELDKKIDSNLHLNIHPIFENQYSDLDDVNLLPLISIEEIN
jgi:hypothetical protein